MSTDLIRIYNRLYSFCEARGFAGHDPFDGLSSELFQALPLNNSASARLLWLQMIKRSPVDLRAILRVPPGVNPKGVALFSLAELARFRTTRVEKHASNARALLENLLEHRIIGNTPESETTTSFGYNFDWQSRHFFAPRGTPAIVPTAFASQALIEAYQVFGSDQYLETVREIANFVLNDLQRTESSEGVCFGYTPNDASVIYNASLLAAECVGRVGGHDDLVASAARFVIKHQRSDGAWEYGLGDKQGWVDNFHTAYILLSLFRMSRGSASETIQHGINYWIDNFFLEDGTPKYFDNSAYPADIHSAAVAIAALTEMRGIDERLLPLARKVAGWTVQNMLDADGFFYYRVNKYTVNQTQFMRWGQAWMAYALARLIEAEAE